MVRRVRQPRLGTWGFLRLHRTDGPARSTSDQRHGGASIGQNRGRSRANGDPHRHLADRPGRVHVVGHPHAGHVDPRRRHYPGFQPPTLRPDATVGLFLSLENRGNVDLDLTPSFQLPSGWSVSNALEPISLGWTDTVDVVYTLVGDGSGQSGTLEVRFSDAQGRFTWTSPLEVKQLPIRRSISIACCLKTALSTRRPSAPGAIPPVRPSGSNGWSATPVTPWTPRCNLTSTQVCLGHAKHRVTYRRGIPHRRLRCGASAVPRGQHRTVLLHRPQRRGLRAA